MKAILIILCLIIQNFLFAQTVTWQNPIPQGNKLNDVFFIDLNTGWAVGDGGVIMKTTNGGTTWTVTYHSTCIGLNKVFFMNNSIGWAVGVYGTIIKTTDGGLSWVAQNSGIQTNLHGIHFTNVSNGIAVGSLGVILITNNGGTTWTLGGSVSFNPHLYDLYSDNFGNSWVVGSAGRIAKSTDGGITWDNMSSGNNITLQAIQFKTSLIGWAAGSLGVILKSIDGGATWTNSNAGISNSYNFVDINFFDQNNGFALDFKGFIFKTTNGGNSWTIVLNGNLSTLFPIFGAFSLQNLNNILVVGNRGNIQKSNDSGVSWSAISSGVSWDNSNRSIFFTDANNGWAVSRGSTHQKVLKTSNGGQTWVAKLNNSMLQLNNVFFINSTTGWVVGDNGVFVTGKVFKTTDAGENWVEQILLGESVISLSDIQFINENIGLTVGSGGKIFRTTDGGNTWNSQISGITDNILSVFFLDINTAWCTTSNGKILKSSNGGINWIQQTSGFTSNIRDIFFLDANNGFALADHTNILKTTNGGTSWTSQNLGLSTIGGSITLLSIKFFDSNNGVALGYDGERGLCFRTTNNGINWTPNYIPIKGGSPTNSFIKNYFILNQNTFFSVGNFSSILKYVNSNCPPSIIATGTVTTNQISANNVITNGINNIPNSVNVVYQAAHYVELNPGFHANSGSVFKAEIGVCN